MAGKPEPIDPAAKQYAIEEVAKGRGLRDVAEELVSLGYKVSHMKVKRWCDDAKRAPATASSAASTPPPAGYPAGAAEALRARQATAPPPAPTIDPDSIDFEATVRRLLVDAITEMEQHRQASNPRGVSAALNTAAGLLDSLRKADKEKPADPDVLQFSRKEIAAAIEAARQTVAQLTRAS